MHQSLISTKLFFTILILLISSIFTKDNKIELKRSIVIEKFRQELKDEAKYFGIPDSVLNAFLNNTFPKPECKFSFTKPDSATTITRIYSFKNKHFQNKSFAIFEVTDDKKALYLGFVIKKQDYHKLRVMLGKRGYIQFKKVNYQDNPAIKFNKNYICFTQYTHSYSVYDIISSLEKCGCENVWQGYIIFEIGPDFNKK